MTKMIPNAKTSKPTKFKISSNINPKKGKPKIKLSTLEHYEYKIYIFFKVLFPAYLMKRIQSYEEQKKSNPKEKQDKLQEKIELLIKSHDRIEPIHTAFMTCFKKMKTRQYNITVIRNFLRLCELYLNVDVNIHEREDHEIHDLKAKLFPTSSIRGENCNVLTSTVIETTCKNIIQLRKAKERDPRRYKDILKKKTAAAKDLLSPNP